MGFQGLLRLLQRTEYRTGKNQDEAPFLDKIEAMKKNPVLVLALMTATTIPLHVDAENAACSQPPCAENAVEAIALELPHSHQEVQDSNVLQDDMIELNTGPVVSVGRGSPEHLRWLEENKE
jgi:hypothetical protein